jgi:hypothetical protein
VYVADLLSSQFISGQMLGRARVSLNAVAEQSTMGIIQDVLDAGVQLKEVRGDANRIFCHLTSLQLALLLQLAATSATLVAISLAM